MNERERVLRTLRRAGNDRAPVVCPGGMMTMVVTDLMDATGSTWPEAHSDPARMAALTLAAHELGGIENVGVPFCMTIEAEGLGAEVDLGSRESEPRVVRYAIDRLDELERLRSFDARAGRAGTCAEAIRLLKEKAPQLPIVASLSGPVSVATSVLDPLLYYRALRRDREAAHRLTRLSTDAIARFGAVLLEAGADVVCVADPSATGEILGRAAFEEFVVPYVNELLERFRSEHGAPSIVHICGDVRSLGDSLSALRADAVSVDSMVGIDTLRTLVGDKCTMGNVSTHLLERGRPDELYRVARRRLEQGVDVLAPACGLSPRTPLANLRSLSEAAAGSGVHPAGDAGNPGRRA